MFHREELLNMNFGKQMQKCLLALVKVGHNRVDLLHFYKPPSSSCNRTEVTCLYQVWVRMRALR